MAGIVGEFVYLELKLRQQRQFFRNRLDALNARFNIAPKASQEYDVIGANIDQVIVRRCGLNEPLNSTGRFYTAGECFPLLARKTFCGQELLVKLAILDDLIPQNLQTYCDFSIPS